MFVEEDAMHENNIQFKTSAKYFCTDLEAKTLFVLKFHLLDYIEVKYYNLMPLCSCMLLHPNI